MMRSLQTPRCWKHNSTHLRHNSQQPRCVPAPPRAAVARTSPAPAPAAPRARSSLLQAARRDNAAGAASAPAAAGPLVACLQAVEVTALATAAAVQVRAVALASKRRAAQQQQQQQQQCAEPSTAAAAFAHQHQPSFAGLQTTALVVALGCGALLRRIHLSSLLPLGGGPARPASAAVRLVRLEAALAQQQQQAGLMARQLDKLQTRTRLASADAKSPLRALQETCAGHSDALAALAERGALLERRADANDEVVAALQAVGARQFQVCVDAIAAAKREAAGGAAAREREVAALRAAVSKLQASWPHVQPYLTGGNNGASGGGDGGGSGGNGTNHVVVIKQPEVNSSNGSRNGSIPSPDPWSAT